MKLIHLDTNTTFDLREDAISTIAVESPRLFDAMVMNLQEQVDGICEHWSLGDIKGFKDNCDVVFSSVALNVNQNALLKKAVTCVAEEIQETDVYERLIKLNESIVRLLNSIRVESELNIDFYYELKVSDWLKSNGMRLSEPEGTYTERLIGYMETVCKLTGKRIFLLINQQGFVEYSDYEHLSKWLRYQGIQVVFFENAVKKEALLANLHIIDSDLCYIK